jgi:hypothetical protein
MAAWDNEKTNFVRMHSGSFETISLVGDTRGVHQGIFSVRLEPYSVAGRTRSCE